MADMSDQEHSDKQRGTQSPPATGSARRSAAPPSGRAWPCSAPTGTSAAQVIDDVAGRTLAAASTVEADLRSGATGNVEAAKAVGELRGRTGQGRRRRPRWCSTAAVPLPRPGRRPRRCRPRSRTGVLMETSNDKRATTATIAGDRVRESRVININRVAKVVKGGRRFSFTALVVIGDGDGRVGLGYGKAKEVPLAIQKGTEEARRTCSPCRWPARPSCTPSSARSGAGRVLLKPAAPVPVSSPVAPPVPSSKRPASSDVLCKSLGFGQPHQRGPGHDRRPAGPARAPTRSPRLRGLDARRVHARGPARAPTSETERGAAPSPTEVQ